MDQKPNITHDFVLRKLKNPTLFHSNQIRIEKNKIGIRYYVVALESNVASLEKNKKEGLEAKCHKAAMKP